MKASQSYFRQKDNNRYSNKSVDLKYPYVPFITLEAIDDFVSVQLKVTYGKLGNTSNVNNYSFTGAFSQQTEKTITKEFPLLPIKVIDIRSSLTQVWISRILAILFFLACGAGGIFTIWFLFYHQTCTFLKKYSETIPEEEMTKHLNTPLEPGSYSKANILQSLP